MLEAWVSFIKTCPAHVPEDRERDRRLLETSGEVALEHESVPRDPNEQVEAGLDAERPDDAEAEARPRAQAGPRAGAGVGRADVRALVDERVDGAGEHPPAEPERH
ncbi:hypothetical protein [Sorangium sp. So ce131]|uniref:hypothetical protein n=1 Tax=Sorangium sp. So ce131 TaxID=3133282 RepID=UPI003F5E4693